MQQAISANPFHVMAMPTGPVCNAKCAYCYYLGKMDLYPAATCFKMSNETLETFTRQHIEAQPEGTQEVHFVWQGGEPTLMRVPFYQRAVALQKKYARPGMKISNALQTNGMALNDDWGRFLHDHEFLVGISIDGPEEMHDLYRVDMQGKGTWSRVMRGVEVLKKNQVEFNTLTVVQEQNSRHPTAVYRFLRSIGSTFLQFIPIVEHEPNGKGHGPWDNVPGRVPPAHQPHTHGGLVSDRSVPAKRWGTFLSGIFDIWRRKDIGKVFVQHFDMMLGIIMGNPSSLCVHAHSCGRAVAIEHNGDLYSCDHFVNPKNNLGNIGKVHLAAMLDCSQQKKFGNDKHDALPAYCQSCKYLKVCFGGCPTHRIINTPSGEDGLNYLCEGYMAFYKHTWPYWAAMAECLHRRISATNYQRFL